MLETIGKLQKPLAAISGLLMAATAALTALGTFQEMLEAALPWVPGQVIRWVTPLILLGIALALFRSARSQRSRLVKPERLRLDPAQHPEQLVERSADVARVVKACQDFRQVHLVGESGCGKSTLVTVGLIPALRQETSFALIHVDTWGPDWETGPTSAVAGALWDALTPDQRTTLKLDRAPAATDVAATMARLAPELGLRPLLIFDQFDDYQTRHRDHFFSEDSRKWLTPANLARRNPFWRMVRQQLADGIVHCLFVTRLDAVVGLESVRFTDPETLTLGRLPKRSVHTLLAMLTTPAEGQGPVVLRPDDGWTRLITRLEDDLAVENAVLPAQMRLAFLGLTDLVPLTLREYEKIGGHVGLERLYVEKHVREAALISGLTPQQVTAVLLEMVDRAKPDAMKTRAVPLSALVSAGGPDAREGAVARALHDLRQKELVRELVDADRGIVAFKLYHDYLCRPVDAAHRRANRWQARLDDARRAYARASGLGERWAALLPIATWARIAWETLRRRLDLGQSRAYFAISLIRLTVPAAVLVVVLAAGAWYRSERRSTHLAEQATQALLALGTTDATSLTGDEIRTLWELAQSDEELKRTFVKRALSNKNLSHRLISRADPIATALVGVRPSSHASITATLTEHMNHPSSDPEINLAAATLGMQLRITDAQFVRFAFRSLKDVVDARGGRESAKSKLLATLERFSHRIPNAHAVTAFQAMMVDLARPPSRRSSSWDDTRVSVRALAAAASQMTGPEAAAAHQELFVTANAARGALSETAAAAFTDLAARIADADVGAVANQYLDVMSAQDAEAVQVGVAVQASLPLVARLGARERVEVFRRVLEVAARQDAGSDSQRVLGSAMGAISKDLQDPDKTAVVEGVSGALRAAMSPSQVAAAASAVRAVSAGLSDAQMAELTEVACDALRRATDANSAYLLQQLLTEPTLRLTPDQAQGVVDSALGVVDPPRGDTSLSYQLVAEMVPRMSDAQAERAAVIALARLRKPMTAEAERDFFAFDGWLGTLETLCKRLPGDVVQRLAAPHVEAAQTSKTTQALLDSTQILSAMAAKMSDAQLASVVDRLLATARQAITALEAPNAQVFDAMSALKPFARRMSEPQVRTMLDLAADGALGGTSGRQPREIFRIAITIAAPHLTENEARTRFAEALTKSRRDITPAEWEDLFVTLSARLSESHMAAMVDAVIKEISDAEADSSAHRVHVLLRTVAGRMNDTQLLTAFDEVLAQFRQMGASSSDGGEYVKAADLLLARMSQATARKCADRVLAAMPETPYSPYNLLDWTALVRVAAAPGRMTADQARAGIDRGLTRMAASPRPYTWHQLVDSLEPLLAHSTRAQSARMNSGLLNAMRDRAHSPSHLRDLTKSLSLVPGNVDESTVLEILKFPSLMHDARQGLLTRLGSQAKQDFAGDTSAAGEWARRQGKLLEPEVAPLPLN